MTLASPLELLRGADGPPPRLRAHGLRLGYGDRAIVHDVDLEVRPGALTVVVGANASGKSTLVRGLARLLPPAAGRVTLDGVDLGRLPSRRLARTIGVLPQNPIAQTTVGMWRTLVSIHPYTIIWIIGIISVKTRVIRSRRMWSHSL